MTEFSKARRQLMLNSAAWIGGLAAVAAAAKPAGAAMQQVEVPAASPLGIAIVNRCQATAADHDAIKARLRAELVANPSLRTLTGQCPLCGCPVTVSRS